MRPTGTHDGSTKNAEVRRGLQPLVDFAGETGCAVLGGTHFTKGTTGRDPTERVTGSLAFGALARLAFGANPPGAIERDRAFEGTGAVTVHGNLP